MPHRHEISPGSDDGGRAVGIFRYRVEPFHGCLHGLQRVWCLFPRTGPGGLDGRFDRGRISRRDIGNLNCRPGSRDAEGHRYLGGDGGGVLEQFDVRGPQIVSGNLRDIKGSIRHTVSNQVQVVEAAVAGAGQGNFVVDKHRGRWGNG